MLGLIVERVTGHTFAEELERRILGPLGLHSTRLEVGVIRGPHARSYILPDGPRSLPGGRPLAVDGHNTGAWAAGALVSNVNDLATFFGALVDGNLLPARLQKAMFTQTSKVPYGLGITRSERRGNRTVGLSKTPRRS